MLRKLASALARGLASFYENGPNGWVYPGALTVLHLSAELAALLGSPLADAWLTKHAGQSISLIGVSLGPFLGYRILKRHSDNGVVKAQIAAPEPQIPIAPHVADDGPAA